MEEVIDNNTNIEFIELINTLDASTLCSVVANFLDEESIRDFLISKLPEPYKEEIINNFKENTLR